MRKRRKKRKPRVYISLPISGFSIAERKAYAKKKATEIKANFLNKMDVEVNTITPFDICTQKGLQYEEYLGRDIAVLATCDVIVMCEGWRKSLGCKVEYYFAKTANIIVEYTCEDDLIELECESVVKEIDVGVKL